MSLLADLLVSREPVRAEERQRQTLALLKRYRTLSADELSQKMHVTTGYARKILRELVEQHKVVKLGSTRTAVYRLRGE